MRITDGSEQLSSNPIRRCLSSMAVEMNLSFCRETSEFTPELRFSELSTRLCDFNASRPRPANPHGARIGFIDGPDDSGLPRFLLCLCSPRIFLEAVSSP